MQSVEPLTLQHSLYALLLIALGYFLAKTISQFITSKLNNRLNEHHRMLFRRLIFYSLLLLFVLSALKQMGFELSVLLGAAGIFTVAISFASQTSMSNLISGIFLLIEHPFRIGNTITYKNFTGNVESVNLLSTKIRTNNNTLIRIPNEALIKTEIITLSPYKIEPLNMTIHLDEQPSTKLSNKMTAAINSIDEILNSPLPSITIKSLSENKTEINIELWCKQQHFDIAEDMLEETILKKFKNSCIVSQTQLIKNKH